MTTVVVTGSAGRVGRRLIPRLVANDEVDEVVGLDLIAHDAPKGSRAEVCDLVSDEIKPLLEGADVVAHLASAFIPNRDGLDSAPVDLTATRRLLEAAGAVGVRKLVLLSSAMVYGAWPDNPVPLTEEAPLHPNSEFSFAVYKAEVERLAAEWQNAHPGTTVVVLRPTTAIARGETSWVARALRAAETINVGDEEPPVQFLHLDDLATAIELAVVEDLSGSYNVAPTDWVSSDDVRELDGRTPRVTLPESAADQVADFRWRHGLAPTPPGLLPYTRYSWVVAVDRLRAAGWEPTHSSQEAYVDGYRARPWAMLNSRRRQQLALGGAAAVAAAAAAGAAVAVRALRRR